MALNNHATLVEQLAAVDNTVDDLVILGVLPAKDADQAKAASQRAHRADKLARDYPQHVRTVAVAAGRKLADVDDLTIEQVIGAVALPQPETIDVACAAVWNEAVTEARRIAFAHVTDAPAKLTARMTAIADEYNTKLRPKLSSIPNADAAISAGLVNEWTRVGQLQAEYKALTNLRDKLRSYRLIPAGAGYNGGGGAHWNFRERLDSYVLKRAAEANERGDNGRALFDQAMQSEPYVPASDREANAVLKAQDLPVTV